MWWVIIGNGLVVGSLLLFRPWPVARAAVCVAGAAMLLLTLARYLRYRWQRRAA